jgi:outer membrane lipoprotein-sorting protein
MRPTVSAAAALVLAIAAVPVLRADAPPTPVTTVTAETMDADEIMLRLDKTMTFETRESRATMTIRDGEGTRVKELKVYSRGGDTAYTIFLSPQRDRGTKYLKSGGQLWMYLPSAEKVMKISGHMLRRPVMGSDFSYEDLLDAPTLRREYAAARGAVEDVDGARCVVLDLTARSPSVSYPTRRLWVDVTGFFPRKSELYARGGRLLKHWAIRDWQSFGDRRYPTRFIMSNALQRGSSTELLLQELRFDVALPPETFSLANLSRGN